ncbi:hypothetical protein ACIRPT_32550 [Streptomyces sp. NPDC101227]|uniref:hypothetical protein n=1 Tax=Streptomyces sp. NPDC101227 TaxID=3366136 RepID=UPI00382FFDC6
MATARSPLRSVRDRGSAVPLRLLWPALLVLFCVALAHGARAESAEGHAAGAVPAVSAGPLVSAGPAAPAAATDPTAASHMAVDEDGHGVDGGRPAPPSHVHSPELCLSGQPQQGPVLTLPCAARAAEAPARSPLWGRSGATGEASALPPLRSATGSVVQQV